MPRSLPRRMVVYAAALLAFAAVACLDFITGSEISFSVFYLIPISILSWSEGLGVGLAGALLGSIIWFRVEMISGRVYSDPYIPVWNALVRLTFFALIAFSLAKRKQLEAEQQTLLRKTQILNKSLKDFAHIVAHDLKNPVHAIMALARFVREEAEKQPPVMDTEKLRAIERRSLGMDTLINGILTYSKVTRTEESIHEFSLDAVLEEVLAALPPHPQTVIRRTSALPRIRGEKVKMFQVFQNLIGNALKYTEKPGGEISISAGKTEDFWKMAVTDNGPGIPEEYRENLFEMFVTVPGKEKGTGIGLSIVKTIVEDLGGEAGFESETGKGTTFYFTLPNAVCV